MGNTPLSDFSGENRLALVVKAMQYNAMQSIQMESDWKGNLGRWYFDIDRKAFYFNTLFMLAMGKAFENIAFVYSYEEVIGMVVEDDREMFDQAFNAYIGGEGSIIEFIFRLLDTKNQTHHIFISGKRVHESWQLPFISGELYDVSSQYLSRKEQQALENAGLDSVSHDPLTGLLNKEYFLEHLRHVTAVARTGQKSFSLMVIDLDFFKNINTHFGYDKGDEVLKEVGRVLLKETRGTDFTGRVAGDRFMTVLSDVDMKTGQIIAERIRKAMANHMFISGIRITVSGGLVNFNNESYEELIVNVNALLKNSKLGGHNSISYKK